MKSTMWDWNETQFARLLAQVELTSGQRAAIKAETGLSDAEVNELVERSKKRYAEDKPKIVESEGKASRKAMKSMRDIALEAKAALEAKGVYNTIRYANRRNHELVMCLGWDYFKKKGYTAMQRKIDAVSDVLKEKYDVKISVCADSSGDYETV